MTDSDLVYSSEKGRICPKCSNPKSDCNCHAKSAMPASDGIVRVSYETTGKKGKGMTIIKGVPLKYEEALNLAKELKQKCGVGGTLKNGIIEIQGDKRELIIQDLTKRGFSVK